MTAVWLVVLILIGATTSEIDSFTQMTATFNLNGAPQRTWDVRVERAALTYTLDDAFRTLPNAPARLEMNLVMPGFPTRTSVAAGRKQGHC